MEKRRYQENYNKFDDILCYCLKVASYSFWLRLSLAINKTNATALRLATG